MIPHLYRFRSIKRMLGDDFQELKKQEIYFSPPDQLNDPMEGYKDVFWLGDKIVWRNLLRHYLLCLLQTAYMYLTMGPKFKCTDLRKIVLSTPEDLPDAPIRSIYQKVCETLLAQTGIRKFLEAMPSRSTPVRRNEITTYLRILHPFALSVVMGEVAERRSVPSLDLASLRAHVAGSNGNLGKLVELKPSQEGMAEELFLVSELAAMQLDLIQDYNTEVPPEAQAWRFLVRSFPASYIRALDELVHSPWHTACFVANPTDASMWGTYGDGHRGVCLKFMTSPDTSGGPALNLYRINGWRGGKGNIEPTHAFVLHTFHKVTYSEAYPEIDFFRSIGRLSTQKLTEFWYNGDTDKLSSCGADIFSDETAWRERYWNAFHSGSICKTAEWEHEKEYRLVLSSSLHDFSDVTSRKLR